MSYSKTTWVNDATPAINATNLNKIETGIKDAHDHIAETNPHSGSAASGANSDITSLSGLTTDLSIAQGGTGQSTAQAAINVLTQVSGATDEYVFTKDTGTGNATWKASAGLDIKRTAVGAGDYNPSELTTDYIIAVDDTTAARSVIISTEDVQSGTTDTPRVMHIVDESGGAGTNNITITLENAGTISGDSSVIISANYNAVSIYMTGTNGFIY